jgi:hypothetical protein
MQDATDSLALPKAMDQRFGYRRGLEESVKERRWARKVVVRSFFRRSWGESITIICTEFVRQKSITK